MRRESHVRFCEGGGVKLPSATRLVIVCELQGDAEKLMAVLPKRFGKYGLKLHPEKTRLVRFTKPSYKSAGKDGGEGGPGTFDLLGFTHYWRRSYRSRTWVIQRKTASSRLSRAIRRVMEWCRTNRHLRVVEQFKALASKLRGHYQYFGLTGNGRDRRQIERCDSRYNFG